MIGNEYKKIKAMIIDDHDPIRKAMRIILSGMNFRSIIECINRREAIAILREQSDIGLILSDIHMKNIDGFEILHYIRNRNIGSDIPFIIVTGETNRNDIVRANDLGANDYIIKPFQAESLTNKVNKVLGTFLNPSPIMRHLRAGDKALGEQKKEEALQLYQKALSIEPENKRAIHSYALALIEIGRHQEALTKLQKGVEDSPSYYRYYGSLADLYLKMGEKDLAIQALQEELEQNPKQPERQIKLAKIMIAGKNFDGGIDHFRKALQEAPKHPQALYGLCQAYFISDDINKALQSFKRMRRYDPTDQRPLQAVVKYTANTQHSSKGEGILKEEAKMYPERLDLFAALGQFYLAEKKLEPALDVINRLLKADAENHEGLKVMAKIEIFQKNYSKALNIIEQLHKFDAEARLIQADCLLKLGKLNHSIMTLHKLLKYDTKNSRALLFLASIYQRQKQYTKAFMSFNRALKLGANKKVCLQGQQVCEKNIQARRLKAS